MITHSDKKQENKTEVAAADLSKKQSSRGFVLVDNRPEAIAQRKLKELAGNSPRVKNQHLIQKKENTTGMPDQLKTGVENLSGYSMDDVKVHYNSDKPSQLQAHAYAQGTDIHVASGQEKHLPHEAWHVVQQKQGRVKPTTQLKGANINDDGILEKEADVMGAKARQVKSIPTRGNLDSSSMSDMTFQLAAIVQDGKNESDQLQRVISHLEELYKAAQIVQSQGEATPGIEQLAQKIAMFKKVATSGDVAAINEIVMAFREELAGESPATVDSKIHGAGPVQQKSDDAVVQRLADAAIAGIVVGAVVGLALLVGGIYACVSACRNRNEENRAHEPAMEAPDIVVQAPPRRDGARVRREADDGPLDPDRARALLGFITQMETFALAGNYREAAVNMFERVAAVQRAFGINLEIAKRREGAVACAERNMSFASEGRIRLCIPENDAWLDDRDVARIAMPMYIEEFMHQYQARSNQFLSPATSAFRQQSALPDMAETRGIGDADFDEIDVMARLLDRGFDVAGIGYVDRYPERRAFMDARV